MPSGGEAVGGGVPSGAAGVAVGTAESPGVLASGGGLVQVAVVLVVHQVLQVQGQYQTQVPVPHLLEVPWVQAATTPGDLQALASLHCSDG